VGLRAGLDSEVRGKIFTSAGDRTSIAQSSSLQPDTILTELPRLLNTNKLAVYSRAEAGKELSF
jgi:hypothetical protein